MGIEKLEGIEAEVPKNIYYKDILIHIKITRAQVFTKCEYLGIRK